MRNDDTEFPYLKAMGLKTVKTVGDGNCLFYALSDGMIGGHSMASEIRNKCAQHMRDNPAEYRPFIHVEVGGGFRRNPKRKNTVVPPNPSFPTEDQVETAFQTYLARISCNGQYGDNLTIRAFAKVYNVDVRIYNFDSSYYVKPEIGDRQVVHIAYHDYEHYSSVRNIDGPHLGPPNVIIREDFTRDQESKMGSETDATEPFIIKDWMMNSVVASLLPAISIVSESAIRNALMQSRGNVDAAVSQLLQDSSSTPTTPSSFLSSGGSSIQRDTDTEDDDEVWGMNKRRDRRLVAARNGARTTLREKALQQANDEIKDIPPLDLNQSATIASTDGEVLRTYSQTSEPMDTAPSQLDTSSSSQSSLKTFQPLKSRKVNPNKARREKTLPNKRSTKTISKKLPKITLKDKTITKTEEILTMATSTHLVSTEEMDGLKMKLQEQPPKRRKKTQLSTTTSSKAINITPANKNHLSTTAEKSIVMKILYI